MTVRQASCTENGEQQNTCARCGKTETVALEKLSHKYQIQRQTKGNCRDSGMIVYKCTRCSQNNVVTTPKDPDAHHWVEKYKGFYCSICYTSSCTNDYSLFTDIVGNTTPKLPELPSVTWDLTESMRTKTR